MTENPTRRKVLKGAAAAGVAATGVGAFGGNSAAQENGAQQVDLDTENLQITPQRGQQQAAGLIVVQLQNLNVTVQDVVDAVVQIGDDVVEIRNIRILNNNNVQLNVADVVDVEGNQVLAQVALTVLGATEQEGEQEELDFEGDDTVDVQQTG